MWKMLKHIGKTHRRKLITTFSLVGLDNLLLLVYPVFGSWAINAVMEGNVWQAMLYGVVVLLMWIIGAARRMADTRTFTKIYTEIAIPVVWNSANEKYRIPLLLHASPYRVSLSVFLKNTCPSLLLRWSPSSVHV